MYLALLGMSLLAAGCASGPTAGRPPADREVTVSEGTTFTVVLAGAAGAAAGWRVAGVDGDTVSLVERRPAAADGEVFVFLARRSGTATLRFTPSGPGPERAGVVRAYRVQVIRC